MTAMLGRILSAFNPTALPKADEGAIRFAVLGAANIGPMALFNPAKTHPEVIIQAVAARDIEKAKAYAKANGIPDVKGSYQELLDDPEIDAIYIPLPNAHHYEWAVKAIRAGKHVLIEKPLVSNAKEAEQLFSMPELSAPNAPVVLEAFHTRFYPSWQLFKTLVDGAEVEKIHTKSMLPWWMTGKDQIYFDYKLSGGTIMSTGTYNLAALREFFGAEPVECLSCDVTLWPDESKKQCDTGFKATFRFPNGGIGIAESTLVGPTIWEPSSVVVTMKETTVPDSDLPKGQTKYLKREMVLYGILFALIWHRIDTKDTYTIREGDKVIKTWTESSKRKAYTFGEAGGKFADLPGETDWISYRHLLEQFVNKVKGRDVQFWVDGKDSINQMKMIDMAYEKSGLGIREGTNYQM